MVNLGELLTWLRSGRSATSRTDFPVGTVLPDGRLDLCKQALGPYGMRLVAGALPVGGPTRHLLLGTDELGDDGADVAAESAVRSGAADGAEELYASATGLGDQGAALLADAMRPGRLRRLAVASNGIETAGLVRLAERAVTAGIELLDLGRVSAARHLGALGNRLGDDGAAQVAHALAGAPHRLAHLDLRRTGMTSRGALQLLAGAQRAVTPTRYLLGDGIASRVKRDLNALASAVPPPQPHPAVAAIRSVHRAGPRP